MSLASITMTRNDWHVLAQWQEFYRNYAGVAKYHIIVDNASTPEYKAQLRTLFPDAVLLERETNGGTTGAYNTGIKWALEQNDIDAVMLIANDIKIDADSVGALYHRLQSDPAVGAVAPVLLQGDRKTVCAYGEKLNKYLGLNRLQDGCPFLPEQLPAEQESDCLPGGMCMVKTEVYRKAGLQDESLFMYMDENEFFFRTRRAGYRLLALRDAVAAHCHIAVDKGRHNDSGLAFFYIYRNWLLVCRQYASRMMMFRLFCRLFFLAAPKYTMVFLRDRSFSKIYYLYLGLFSGLLGCRKNSIHN